MTTVELEETFNKLKKENIQLAQSVAQAQVQITRNEGQMQLLQKLYADQEKEVPTTTESDGGDRDQSV